LLEITKLVTVEGIVVPGITEPVGAEKPPPAPNKPPEEVLELELLVPYDPAVPLEVELPEPGGPVSGRPVLYLFVAP